MFQSFSLNASAVQSEYASDSDQADTFQTIDIEQLPDNVLRKIFSNCDYNTLVELNVTCLRFSRILEDEQLWTKGVLEELERKQSTFKPNNSPWQSPSGYNPNLRQSKDKAYLHSFGMSIKGPLATIQIYDSIAEGEKPKSKNKNMEHVKNICGDTISFVFLCIGVIAAVALCGCGLIGWGFALSATHYDNRFHGFDYWILSNSLLSIAVVIISVLLFFFKISRWEIFLMNIAIIFLLLPSFWVDRIAKSTHWFGFIPYSLAIIGLFVFLIYLAVREWKLFGLLAFCVFIASASYILALMKLDEIVGMLWSVLMIPFFVAIPIAIPPLVYLFDDEIKTIFDSTGQFVMISAGLIILAYYLVLIPILISDGVLPWNYHLSMIPLYLAYAAFSVFILFKTFSRCAHQTHAITRTIHTIDAEKQMSGAFLYDAIVNYLKEES
ncbi:hypothetical protein BLNAU_22677 [Blattamonas nauphoetae]|uniref:F-box domain-containing protein n=1 Tax=Blattamonas nauphoetae TaxID=2049346 RepID=A0ABQ9WSD2_9EUKA|nr:hypothetical protein BLNAU_22677 [Blattamonas nauphoetae]